MIPARKKRGRRKVGKASRHGRALRWVSQYRGIEELTMDLEPVRKNRADITITLKGAQIVRTRHNVWKIVNVTFEAGFEVEIDGQRHKPKCMLSMWVKSARPKYLSQIARNFQRRAHVARKQTGVVPCQ